MQPQSITLKVSPQTAKAFQAATESEKRLAEELLEVLFQPKRRKTLAEFKAMAETANRGAVQKGLTESKLKKLLDEA